MAISEDFYSEFKAFVAGYAHDEVRYSWITAWFFSLEKIDPVLTRYFNYLLIHIEQHKAEISNSSIIDRVNSLISSEMGNNPRALRLWKACLNNCGLLKQYESFFTVDCAQIELSEIAAERPGINLEDALDKMEASFASALKALALGSGCALTDDTTNLDPALKKMLNALMLAHEAHAIQIRALRSEIERLSPSVLQETETPETDDASTDKTVNLARALDAFKESSIQLQEALAIEMNRKQDEINRLQALVNEQQLLQNENALLRQECDKHNRELERLRVSVENKQNVQLLPPPPPPPAGLPPPSLFASKPPVKIRSNAGTQAQKPLPQAAPEKDFQAELFSVLQQRKAKAAEKIENEKKSASEEVVSPLPSKSKRAVKSSQSGQKESHTFFEAKEKERSKRDTENETENTPLSLNEFKYMETAFLMRLQRIRTVIKDDSDEDRETQEEWCAGESAQIS